MPDEWFWVKVPVAASAQIPKLRVLTVWSPGRWLRCCCSVAKLCPTLCDPMNCCTPSFPVLHYLPSFSDLCPLSWWCHPTILSSVTLFSSCPLSFPASGSFPMSWLFPSGGQSTGASASASVLPMNIQGWFPLGLTDWISLLSKGISRVLSRTAIQSDQFFCTQPFFFIVQLSHPYTITGKTIALIIRTFVGKVMSLHCLGLS